MDRRSDTRGYTINVAADAACESTVKSRFRDVQTITRTNQAPARSSRVHAITMDPSDTSQNKLIHIANPKFYSGFMQRLAVLTSVVAAALSGRFRGVEGGTKGLGGLGVRGGGRNDAWRRWRRWRWSRRRQ